MSSNFCACSNSKGFWKSQFGIAIKWIPIVFLVIAGTVALYFLLCLMGVAGSIVVYPGSNVYTGCLDGQETCNHYKKLKCYFDNSYSFFGICFLEGFLNTVVIGVLLGIACAIVIVGVYGIYCLGCACRDLQERYREHVLDEKHLLEERHLLDEKHLSEEETV